MLHGSVKAFPVKPVHFIVKGSILSKPYYGAPTIARSQIESTDCHESHYFSPSHRMKDGNIPDN